VGLTSVQTRQKSDVLFQTQVPLKAGASIGLGPAECDGFSSLSILAVSDQPFTITLFEALVPGGPFVQTQVFTSVSSSGVQSGPFPLVAAGPGFAIAQKFFVTGSFVKATVQNTGSVAETLLSAVVRGNPTP
jgi:hypothetical protein